VELNVSFQHKYGYIRDDVVLITHRRSVAKRGGCFRRRLFVRQFVSLTVCLFVRAITSERLSDDETWRLLYKNLAQFECKGQRSKVKVTGEKRKNAESSSLTMFGKANACAVGRTLHAAVGESIVCPPGGDGGRAVHVDGGLRAVFVRSGPRGRGYAGGKISACCLVWC